ncbi:zinc carboxypeptidase [Ophiocordyceps camponoti-floridani]|uniref:Zinc carboxypeptidase n=1 Tax=Ophiocordyceps camponoti-floridani TaxID=2030778 RepID=A0A8H4Q5C0_9HYPO|nr:zinc carboxypeptidase [Ophiocordyceps camponoti-floridani]
MKPRQALISTLTVSTCVLGHPLDQPQQKNYASTNQKHPLVAIGNGDRFRERLPRGMGIIDGDQDTSDATIPTILNLAEIESGLDGLSRAYDDVHLLVSPSVTAEGRQIKAIRAGATKPRVIITSGVHGRERGGPDHVFGLVADLLAARARNSSLRYGSRIYDAESVRTALSAGILLLPVVNPDGLAYDQLTSSCWRKNRNPAGAVDINRNFNYTWHHERLFAADVEIAVSDDASQHTYRGTAPLSEPESRAVAGFLAGDPSLTWFLDVHSFGYKVMYGWGVDDMQTVDPGQNFANSSYDGRRGSSDSSYGEFIEADDLLAMETVSHRIAKAMSQGSPRSYEAMPIASFARAATGSSIDQAMGPYYAGECGAHRINGLAIEFGSSGRFGCRHYPDVDSFRMSSWQVAVGLMELLLAAAEGEAETKTVKCS